jgi:predicted nucleic acid-binding Zn ribbon protein
LGTQLGLPTRVMRVWDEVVGESLAARSQPRWLRDGVLVVEVDDPAWTTQIRWLEADLVARLTEVLGPGQVTEIEVRVARA